jgi:hypothetical protein
VSFRGLAAPDLGRVGDFLLVAISRREIYEAHRDRLWWLGLMWAPYRHVTHSEEDHQMDKDGEEKE